MYPTRTTSSRWDRQIKKEETDTSMEKVRRTAAILRKEAIARGLCVGAEVKVEYSALQKDYTLVTRRVEHGVVTALYPYIFACEIGGFTVCFRYAEFIFDQSTKVRLRKEAAK